MEDNLRINFDRGTAQGIIAGEQKIKRDRQVHGPSENVRDEFLLTRQR